MKFKSYISVVALMAAISFTACQDDYENVENRVLDSGAQTPSLVLMDGTVSEETVSFNVSMVELAPTDVNITYGVDFSLVDVYNTIYNEKAIALPADNYEILQAVATIPADAVKSSDVEVRVFNLDDLDRDLVYVLPLTVKKSDVPVLESMRNRYIVVRGAALINVVCNMVENNAAFVNAQAPQLGSLGEMTFQCLFYVEEWGGAEANIQTLAGIEGQWLLRIADSGLPVNQLQFVTPSGNITSSEWQLPNKKWVAMTFTWKSATGEATLFVDGVKKATMTNGSRAAVNWNSSEFHIGKSWSDGRWLNGNISEVRVWNRILSDAEIAEPTQPYTVSPESDGLVSYWKFNEGEGTMIKDYTNGYNLQMAKNPKWVQVSLPE